MGGGGETARYAGRDDVSDIAGEGGALSGEASGVAANLGVCLLLLAEGADCRDICDSIGCTGAVFSSN